jgi:hypothetical protein
MFKKVPSPELADLHAEVLHLSRDASQPENRHNNLVNLLEKVEEELCARCSATSPEGCTLPGPPLQGCLREFKDASTGPKVDL